MIGLILIASLYWSTQVGQYWKWQASSSGCQLLKDTHLQQQDNPGGGKEKGGAGDEWNKVVMGVGRRADRTQKGGQVHWQRYMPNPHSPTPIHLHRSTWICAIDRSTRPAGVFSGVNKTCPSDQNSHAGCNRCHVGTAASLHGTLQWIGL